MEQTISLQQESYNKEEVMLASDAVEKQHGIRLCPSDIDNLLYGEKTSLLHDLKVGSGGESKIKDAKIQLSRDKDGNVKVNYHFSRTQLEIPKSILDKELDKEQDLNLRSGKKIGPFKKAGKNLFVSIDKDLNSISIYTEKAIGLKREIGGYKFKDQELEILANGGKIGARVYKGEQGYFLAELSQTPDAKGIQFSEIKALTQERAIDLISQLNAPIEKKRMANTQITGSIEIKSNESQPESTLQEDILSAIGERDFKKLNILSSQVSPIEVEGISTLINHNEGLTREDKIAILTTLGIDTTKYLVKEHNMAFNLDKQVPEKQKHFSSNKSFNI